MKKIVLVAALAALAACSKQEAAPTDAATETAATEAAAPTPAVTTVAADGKPSTGTFKITSADGKTFTEEVKADGTTTTTQDGKVVETGKWEQKAPETYCFTKDEKDAKQECSTEKVDEKGVWTSVNPKGKVVTVERVGG